MNLCLNYKFLSVLQFSSVTNMGIQDVSWNCYEVIKGSWEELEAMSTQKEALAELSKAFRTCKWVMKTGFYSVNLFLEFNFDPSIVLKVAWLCNG